METVSPETVSQAFGSWGWVARAWGHSWRRKESPRSWTAVGITQTSVGIIAFRFATSQTNSDVTRINQDLHPDDAAAPD
jgi:hypothetical protein